MRVAYADEAGTDANSRCYAIGVLSFAADRVSHFQEVFDVLKKQHGVVGEAKWGKISKGHGLINFALAWLDRVLRSRTASFDVIVVHTALYRLWMERGADRENAFYKTYTYLLRHIARRTAVPTMVFLDDRSDAYPLQRNPSSNGASRDGDHHGTPRPCRSAEDEGRGRGHAGGRGEKPARCWPSWSARARAWRRSRGVRACRPSACTVGALG